MRTKKPKIGIKVNLDELINYLKNKDPNIIIKKGFGKGFIHKGFRNDLVFKSKKNTSVGSMLQQAKYAKNRLYKIKNKMLNYSNIWIDYPDKQLIRIDTILLNKIGK